MNILNMTADSKISHGMPIPLFGEFTRVLIAAKGREVPMDSVIGEGRCLIYLENASRGCRVNGGHEMFPSKKHSVFFLLSKDATIEFTCPNGDVWYAHNDPIKNEVVVKNKPIIVPERILDSVTNWLLNGERGTSSNAMCQRLFGGAKDQEEYCDYPHDPSDFRRCRLFVESTGCRDRLGEMAAVSPTWAMYVKHWDELCEMMDAEVDWMKGDTSGCSTNTFAAMIAMQLISRDEGENELCSAANGQLSFARTANSKMESIIESRVAMIKALVRYGVNVNARYQPNNSTPLALAINRLDGLTGKLKPFHIKTIEALIECGADINANLPGDKTVADLARESCHADILCCVMGVAPDGAADI